MAKKPLPPTMDPANVGKNPPFVPLTYKTTVGPPPGAGIYQEAGVYLKLYDYSYAGLNQTSIMNVSYVKPPRQTSPSAGDKNHSKIQ